MSWDYVPGKYAEGRPDLAAIERQYKGKQSRAAGNQFEDLISDSLAWYEEKGVACIEKTPEPMKPLRAPNHLGQFLACFTKAGQPDYKGTLNGGRAIVFEAKHTDSDQMKYDRLTDEQIDRLKLHYKLGAATYVMVSFGLEDFFRIPWEVWRDMKAIYGRKYIKAADVEQYRVPYMSGVLKLLD